MSFLKAEADWVIQGAQNCFHEQTGASAACAVARLTSWYCIMSKASMGVGLLCYSCMCRRPLCLWWCIAMYSVGGMNDCRWCLSGFSGSFSPVGGRKQQCPFCEDVHWGGTSGQPLVLEGKRLFTSSLVKLHGPKWKILHRKTKMQQLYCSNGHVCGFLHCMFGSLNRARRGFLSTKCILAWGAVPRPFCLLLLSTHPLRSSLLFFFPPNTTQSCLLFVCWGVKRSCKCT